MSAAYGDNTDNSQLTVPDLLSDDELQKIIDAIIKKIFSDRSIAHVSDDMYDRLVDLFTQAVTKGYGVDINDVDQDSIDYRKLLALSEDVIRFSAAKDKTMNRAIFNELTDSAGHFRSFKDFRNEALNITTDHTGVWLKSEYNFAIASSQMNQRWKIIEEERDVLGLLQYETVGDDRVRPAHRELEGVTRPIDDWFWDQYFPPNGWNCRCTVRQLDNGEITPTEQIITPDNMPDMFKVNFGKHNLVFPPNHPYYKNK